VTGREPYLTEAEWSLVQAEVARQGRRVPAPRADLVCPFLTDEARCSIYAVRPLGCRTFYCHRGEGPKISRAALADMPRRLEELSRDPRERGRRLTAWLAP
jgi:Fe-S-cluster containining protein